MMDVAPQFIRLKNDADEVLTPSTLRDIANATPTPLLHLAVELRVKDSLGKTHTFSPAFDDHVQTVVTTIQNCPFVRLPMKLQYQGRDIPPTAFLWNLLRNSIDMTELRASEVHFASFSDV